MRGFDDHYEEEDVDLADLAAGHTTVGRADRRDATRRLHHRYDRAAA